MAEPIAIRALVQVHPDRIEDFIRILQDAASGDQTPRPDGPQQAAFYIDDTSGRAIFLETHNDSAELLANLNADDDGDRVALSRTYELLEMDVYGVVSDEVRQTLAGNAHFYDFVARIA